MLIIDSKDCENIDKALKKYKKKFEKSKILLQLRERQSYMKPSVRRRNQVLKGRDQTSKTINRKISSLKSFFKYQVRTGVLETTPMTKVISPKNSKRLPSFVQTGQARELIQSLKNTESWKELNTKMLISLF